MHRFVLVFFALIAAASIFAQNPAGMSSHPAPSQASPAPAAATGEDVQPGSPAHSPQTGSGQPATSGTTQNSGQPGQSTQDRNAASGQISAGTEIRATLDTPLSTKTSKPGDRFTATITEPARGGNGALVIPTGTRIEGEVAEAEDGRTAAALRGKGKLDLRFRDIVLPTGQTLPLTATLISVNGTNGKSTKKADEEGQLQSGARNKDAARDVGTGAGAGAAAGLVFGGPLKGLAIGALAGGGYVLSTKGKEINLPAQTGMVIRLDQPVSGSGTQQ
ncbi:MAG TPA: hypothetical protein VKL99_16860 [Candidatus Angelobacter sp.]|nr:hypothetical protein [Candidatus Angelobacter sp.]